MFKVRSGVFIVNFEHISNLVLVFLLLTLYRKMPAGHAINITPSANLLCEIQEAVTGSFYIGQIYVGIKDAVFEASDPLRHIVELLSVSGTEEGINSLSPYLVLFSDGGGGHNLTFLYVQCVLLALFKIGYFNFLNVGGCAPNQSYISILQKDACGLQALGYKDFHYNIALVNLKKC